MTFTLSGETFQDAIELSIASYGTNFTSTNSAAPDWALLSRTDLGIADTELFNGDFLFNNDPIISLPLVDAQAIVIEQTDFQSGMLRLQSYARPSKLFTANEGLIISIEGTLKPEKLNEIREAIIAMLKK